MWKTKLPYKTQNQTAGVSLMELLVFLVLLGILLCLGVPAVRSLKAEHQANAYADRLAQALLHARSKAMQEGAATIFCKTQDGQSCGGHWHQGQLLKNQQGAVLAVYPATPTGASLRWQSSLGQNDQLVFLPSGFTAGQRGSFYYCGMKNNVDDASSGIGRRIIIHGSGRVRVEKSSHCT